MSEPDALGGENPEGLDETLRYGSLGLVQAVGDATLPAGTKLLLIVDQFEEMFRYAGLGDTGEFAAFVKLLLEAVSSKHVPVFVLITLRSEYLAECEQFRGLPEAISESLLLVSRMTRDELRQVIEGPIKLAGAGIEPWLVDRLLNDAGDEQDQLGLLQHALRRTWDRWSSSGDDRTLGLVDYEAVGGIPHSLQLELDGICESLADRARGIARVVFQRLVEQDDAGRLTRRPTRLSELAAVAEASRDEVIAVLDTFRGPVRTFLVPGGVALENESVIDIAHEAIIRKWPRLGRWIAEEHTSAAFYRRLAAAAVEHNAGLASYYREPELTQALQWRERARPTAAWAQRYHPEFKATMSFLDESGAHQQYEIAQIEKTQIKKARRARRARRAIAGSVLVVVVVPVFLALMLYLHR